MKISSLLLLLVLFSCSGKVEETTTLNPNIILIMADDLGWFDTGFNGNKEVRTPNMDLLASKGTIFDRFYSASAVCSPTRASAITGRNPLRMNIPNANKGHMKKEEITIPEMLKELGYKSGHFGKWHLGTLTKTELDANRGGRPEFEDNYTIPTDHGYDEYFCTESKVPTYDPMIFPGTFMEGENKRFGWRAIQEKDSSKNYGTAYWVGENKKETNNLEGDDSRIIMDRVVPFIENSVKENKSFFTTIWFHTPHLPVVSDSIHRSYYKNMDWDKQIYYGTITAMDNQIGRLWETLETLKIAENSIIFFCSDNGPERKTPGSAGVFRERKRSLYEGGVRVPAFAVWENHFQAGKRITFPAVTSDYMPTILDILKIDYPDERPIDGTSILGTLTGTDTIREKPIGFIIGPKKSWVNDHYKLIGNENDENYELYDLIHDKSEREDISIKFPEVAERMKVELLEWLSSVENSNDGRDYID